MKKWNQFLTEQNKKEILQEFNRKDEAAVMKDEDNFSVSFEIELEAADGGDGDGDWSEEVEEAMEEAKREAALRRLGYYPEEHFRESVYENEAESINLNFENPTDGEDLFLAWYSTERDGRVGPDDMWPFLASMAAMGDYDGESEDILDRALIQAMANPQKLLKLLFSPDETGDEANFRKDLLSDLLGWTDQQLTFDFEKEGGKSGPRPVETLTSPGIIEKLINYFVINTKDLNGPDLLPMVREQGVKPLDLRLFIGTFAGEGFGTFTEEAYAAIDEVLEEYSGRYGLTVRELISAPGNAEAYKSYWIGQVITWYRDAVETAADELVDELGRDFENDPVDYLENQYGMEEYEFFDRDQWYSDYGSSIGTGVNCSGDPPDGMLDRMRENFPKFMNKYESNLKFEGDVSLDCGIEFSWDNPPYMTGLKNAIQYLEDFFAEYKQQSFFTFTGETGLHTNVGYLDEYGDPVDHYNLFKGLVFLNHTFATTGMGFPSREGNTWSGDLKQPAIDNIEKFFEKLKDDDEEHEMSKKKFMKMFFNRQFDELENILSNRVGIQASRQGSKSIGFNVNYTENRRYVEFRYPGSDEVNLESMKKALLYYAFIIKAMADPEFKKRDYIKDLVGFVGNLRGGKPTSVAKLTFLKHLKKGDVYLKWNYDNNPKALLTTLIEKSFPKFRERDPDGAYDVYYATVLKLIMSLGRANNVDFGDNLRNYQIVIYEGLSSDKKGVILKTVDYKRNFHRDGGNDYKLKYEKVPLRSFEREFVSGDWKIMKNEGGSRSGAKRAEVLKRFINAFESGISPKDILYTIARIAKFKDWPEELSSMKTVEPHVRKPKIVQGLRDTAIQDLDEVRQRFKKYNF